MATNSIVTASIDVKALKHNVQRVREVALGCRIIAVIKANAYGHGSIPVAQALQAANVDAFAVARLEEALQLREADIKLPILCLEGVFDQQSLDIALQYQIQPVVHHLYQVSLFANAKTDSSQPVWLKIDSGMHRMGVSPDVVEEVYQRLSQSPAVEKVYLMTHLACADDKASPQTALQLEVFNRVTRKYDVEKSIANSAGILGWPQVHSDWVRPGIMLYGVSPFEGGKASDDDLLPVMTLESRVIAVNHYKKGDAIGYGGTWVCPEDMDVAVVACGYGDGYPRHAISGTPVLINGQRLPLVGRVSMDTICIDLRKAQGVSIGDKVILWGAGLPVEEIAECATTIPYELTCSVTGRVRFEYRE